MTFKMLTAGALVILLTMTFTACAPRDAGTAEIPHYPTAQAPTQAPAVATSPQVAAAAASKPSAATPPPTATPGVAMPGPGKGMPRLTPEQRQLVQAKTREMEAAGAKPAAIEATVGQMLKQWGQSLPTCLAGKPGEASAMRQLTPQQSAELTATVRQLQAKGAKPGEVQSGLAGLYESWSGATQHSQSPAAHGAGGHNWMSQLTPKQQAELVNKVKAMKAKGASGEEVRAAVAAMLKAWGLNPPDAGGAPSWMDTLTPTQRDQVNAKIKELKARGAGPDEIMSTVMTMLKSYGITIK